MTNHLSHLAEHWLHTSLEQLTDRERRVLERVAHRQHISRNTNHDFDTSLTLGQRVADRVAAFGGSWTFILLFAATLLTWIALNSLLLAPRHAAFDPYPYILLNLVLSMLAAIQAPIIMMSQNRQAQKDRLDAAHDYEVNLKAELEIAALHEKVDRLREQQWAELVALQQEQLRLLAQLLKAQ
jgi:uncharacterized membrane protein